MPKKHADHKAQAAKGEPQPPPAQEQAEVAARRAEALRLSVEGCSLRAIGQKLGVSHATAAAYVQAELAEVAKNAEADRLSLRWLERARLEQVLSRWLPIATHENLDVSMETEDAQGRPRHIELPDYQAGLKAAEIVVKISARLSALDGLDAPNKQELSGPNGGPIEMNVLTPERQAVLASRTRRLLEGLPKSASAENPGGWEN